MTGGTDHNNEQNFVGKSMVNSMGKGYTVYYSKIFFKLESKEHHQFVFKRYSNRAVAHSSDQ